MSRVAPRVRFHFAKCLEIVSSQVLALVKERVRSVAFENVYRVLDGLLLVGQHGLLIPTAENTLPKWCWRRGSNITALLIMGRLLIQMTARTASSAPSATLRHVSGTW